MLSIFLLLLPLFSIIGLGYLAGHYKIADKQWIKVLNLYGFYIGMPALIFQSIAATEISLAVHGKVILAHTLFAVGLMLTTWFITKAMKLSTKLQNTFTIGVYFSNVAYIGLPALQLVFGDAAAGEGAIIAAIMVLVTFTLGVGILESSKNNSEEHHTFNGLEILNDIIKNPLLWSAVAGITVSLLNISMPETIGTFIKLLAQSASPTVLVALGVFLATNHPKRYTLQLAGILAGIKLIIIPAALGLVLWVLPGNSTLDVFYIQAAMPLAITTFAFAEIYPMDKGVVSSSIVLTTMSAIVLVPFYMWVAAFL